MVLNLAALVEERVKEARQQHHLPGPGAEQMRGRR